MTRPDANRVALHVARSILGAAHDFTAEVAGKALSFRCTTLAAPSWPGALDGLDPDVDRPWPTPVAVDVAWEGGSSRLVAECDYWQSNNDQWRHAVALRVRIQATKRELVWVTLRAPVAPAQDGSVVRVRAYIAMSKALPDEAPASFAEQSEKLRATVAAAGIPPASKNHALLCTVAIPDGELTPDPGQVFERLVLLGAIKHAWFERRDRAGFTGTPFVEVPFVTASAPAEKWTAPAALVAPEAQKFRGIWPLPGGVRSYADTLRALLEHIDQHGSLPVTELERHIRERYDVTGKTALAGYMALLRRLESIDVADGEVTVSDDGRLWLGQPPAALFSRLHARFIGVLELLVLAEMAPELPMAQVRAVICRALDVEWESVTQVMFRRNWLVSLGLTDRTGAGDAITEQGREVLAAFHAEASDVRARLREALAAVDVAVPDPVEAQDGERGSAGTEPPTTLAVEGERLELDASMIENHLKALQVDRRLLGQLAAAVSAGKHVLFIGPPGTGKTELALALARAAQAEGYCEGLFTVTASADWTTFDTIGGYAMRKNGTLEFRPGAFLRALQARKWLLIDELNRADVDRAFGELMTVLSGQGTDTHYELEDGRHVSIGPDEEHTFRVPPSFRILATMNIWDKASLFRLSYAVQRRFALITVGLPDDVIYASILSRAATADALHPPLSGAHLETLHRLFSRAGLLSLRAIGPAVALDVLRYLRRRGAEADGVAEALEMFVLPQLQGLGAADAKAARDCCTAVPGFSAAARSSLEARFEELFPDLAVTHG